MGNSKKKIQIAILAVLVLILIGLLSLFFIIPAPSSPGVNPASKLTQIQNVFVIVMENHTWNKVKNAPYIHSLVKNYASVEHFSDGGIHPSEPNYLWLEAGTDFGIKNDNPPGLNCTNSQSETVPHLVQLLDGANVTWRAYVEDIPGDSCPLNPVNGYAPKHLPMIYFKDVTESCNPQAVMCLSRIRPYTELSDDLDRIVDGRHYTYILPNLCHDMHDCDVKTGDTWLSKELPKIINSAAFRNSVVFITWDEGQDDGKSDIGLIAVSRFSKQGYVSKKIYPNGHSALLKTVQEIFDVKPFLGDAANSDDLSNLFNL